MMLSTKLLGAEGLEPIPFPVVFSPEVPPEKIQITRKRMRNSLPPREKELVAWMWEEGSDTPVHVMRSPLNYHEWISPHTRKMLLLTHILNGGAFQSRKGWKIILKPQCNDTGWVKFPRHRSRIFSKHDGARWIPQIGIYKYL